MPRYTDPRPQVPADIRRAVEIESGHACAVSRCGEHTYLELHHINEDRADNRLENLILLCDKHHKMAHAGIIDAKSLRGYKVLLRQDRSDTQATQQPPKLPDGDTSESDPQTSAAFTILLESARTGEITRLSVPKRATIDWIAKAARRTLRLNEKQDIGGDGLSTLRIHWVLVQLEVVDFFKTMHWTEHHRAHAVFASTSGPKVCYDLSDRIDAYGVASGATFRLHAVGGGVDNAANTQFAYAA